MQLLPTESHLAVSLKTHYHMLLASAAAKGSFTAKGYKGRVGLRLPLLPALAAPDPSPADLAAAKFGDGVLNRWFLDAMYKGGYPADILAVASARHMDLDIQPGDAERVHDGAAISSATSPQRKKLSPKVRMFGDTTCGRVTTAKSV